MAEFSELVRIKKRMCKEFGRGTCKGCPLLRKGCGIIAILDRSDNEFKELEDTLLSWAAEHPEPVYPTWIEWLKKFGIISFEPDFHSLLSAYPTRTNSVKAYINEEGGKPIPADLAQKLGLKPKEC